MKISQIPNKFPLTFGQNAGGSYIRAVPANSQIGIQAGAASLNDGFPPVCFSPISSGGTAPFGQDFNGILNQITAWLQWLQAGGLLVYDASFSTSIGGYPNGAVLLKAAGGGFWQSTADSNTSNPDTGGTNWISIPPTTPNLGPYWQIDSNYQLTNNGYTKYLGAFSNSSSITSGSQLSVNTVVAQQGSNFSTSNGYIVISTAGLYRVTYTVWIVDVGGSQGLQLYFTTSSGTVIGPNSSYPWQSATSSGVYGYACVEALIKAGANASVQLVTNITLSGSAQYIQASAISATIERIG